MKANQKSFLGLLLIALFMPFFLSAENGWDNRFPGDDFSLEGALQLFKNTNNLQDFEQALNSPDNDVNNLDLNNNGRIDYLRVVDHMEGNVHAIVIQDILDQNTSQDVAVIQIKRDYNGEAFLQIIGDADLYGTERIVEPYPYDDQFGPVTSNYQDDYYYDNYRPNVYVNVMYWPVVTYLYAPRYVVWVSPWRWDYYPVWYSPWSPQPWNTWHRRTIVYHHYYRVAPSCRIPEANRFYGPRRQSAPQVRELTQYVVKENGGRTRGSDQRRIEAPRADNQRVNDRQKTSPATRQGNDRRETSPAVQPRTDNRSSQSVRLPERTPQPATRQPKVASPNRETTRPAPRENGNKRVETRSSTGSNTRNQPATQPSRSNPVQKAAPSSPKASSPTVKERSSNRSAAAAGSNAPAKNQKVTKGRNQ